MVMGIICLFISLWLMKNIPSAKQFNPRTVNVPEVFRALGRHLGNPALIGLFLTAFLLRGSFDTLYNYISYPLMAAPYYLSQTFIGLIFLVYLAGTFSSALMGKFADQIGKGKAILISIVMMLAGAF